MHQDKDKVKDKVKDLYIVIDKEKDKAMLPAQMGSATCLLPAAQCTPGGRYFIVERDGLRCGGTNITGPAEKSRIQYRASDLLQIIHEFCENRVEVPVDLCYNGL